MRAAAWATAVLVLGATALAQDRGPQLPAESIWAAQPMFMVIETKGRMLARISLEDGSVEYGADYTPDEAAKQFWQAIGRGARKCE